MFGDITIVSVYGHNDGAGALAAITHSQAQLPGSRALLLSVARPQQLPDGVQWRQIAQLDYRSYSLFIFNSLHEYIETEYALIVQDDGWVLDGENFTPNYLAYDYIGAPCHAAIHDGKFYKSFGWVHLKNPTVIQNGGFSLRSQKLMRAPIQYGIPFYAGQNADLQNEDVQLSGLYRPKLERLGIRYAPLDVARTFSVEYLSPVFHNGLNLKNVVGIHGKTRKLIDHMRIQCTLTREQVDAVFGENQLLRYLESIGYVIERQHHDNANQKGSA